MGRDKLLIAALSISLTLVIFIAIIYSTITNLDSDKFVIIVVINCLLGIPLFLLIIYGRRAVYDTKNKEALNILIVTATIIIIFPFWVIFKFIQNPAVFYDFIAFIILALILIIIWVFNILSFLFPKK